MSDPSAPNYTDQFKTGAVTLQPGTQVPIRKGGKLFTVAAEDAAKNVDAGWELVPPQEFAAHQEAKAAAAQSAAKVSADETENGGLAGEIATAGQGILRPLTLGLSDVAQVKAAQAFGGDEAARDVREKLTGLQRANPKANVAGEIASFLVPGLGEVGGAERAVQGVGALEEASAAARAATGVSPLGLATSAGRQAAKLVTSRLGEGAAAKAIAHTVQAGVEGAGLGVGDQISEDALGDHELNAEKMLGAGVHGALLQGALGGTLGATGEFGRKFLGHLAPRLADAGNEAAFDALGADTKTAREAEELVPGGKREVGDVLHRRVYPGSLAESAMTPEQQLARIAPERVAAEGERNAVLAANAEPLREVAGQQAWDALDPTAKMTAEAMERVKGGPAAVGGVAHEYGLFDGDAPVNPERVAEKADAALETVGAAKGALLAESGATMDAQKYYDSFKPLIDKLGAEAGPDYERLKSYVEDYRDSAMQKLGFEKRAGARIAAGYTATIPEHFSAEQRAIVPDLIERIKAPGKVGEDAKQLLDSMGVKLEKTKASKGADTFDLKGKEIPIGPAFKLRRGFDKTIDWSVAAREGQLKSATMQEMRGIMAEAENKAIGDAYELAGNPEARAQLKKLNADYQALKLIEKATKRTVPLYATNPALAEKAIPGTLAGLTYDQAVAASRKLPDDARKALLSANHDAQALRIAERGAAEGAARMATHGSALGAAGVALATGHPVAAAAIAATQHLAKTRGRALTAAVLERASAIGGIKRGVGVVDREIDRGVAGILRPGERVPVASHERAYEGHPYRAQQAAESVARAVVDSEKHVADVERAANSFGAHAPRIAAAFVRTALRATTWLALQVPQSMRNPGGGEKTLLAAKPFVSATETAAFLRKYDAVHDPASVLDDMRKGRVTREQIDAIKAVYPKLYADIRSRIQQGINESRTPPSYEAQKQLSAFFGIPASPAFAPKFVSAMQAPTAAPPPGKPGGGPKTAKRSIKGIADSAALPGQSTGG